MVRSPSGKMASKVVSNAPVGRHCLTCRKPLHCPIVRHRHAAVHVTRVGVATMAAGAILSA